MRNYEITYRSLSVPYERMVVIQAASDMYARQICRSRFPDCHAIKWCKEVSDKKAEIASLMPVQVFHTVVENEFKCTSHECEYTFDDYVNDYEFQKTHKREILKTPYKKETIWSSTIECIARFFAVLQVCCWVPGIPIGVCTLLGVILLWNEGVSERQWGWIWLSVGLNLIPIGISLVFYSVHSTGIFKEVAYLEAEGWVEK